MGSASDRLPKTRQELVEAHELGLRDFSGLSLPDTDLSHKSLEEITLDDGHLSFANFTSTNLTGASFRRAHLPAARFTDATLTSAQFDEAQLSGAHFEGADLSSAHFTGAHLTLAHFRNARLQGASFTNSSLLSARDLEFDGNEIRGIAAPTRASSVFQHIRSYEGRRNPLLLAWEYYTCADYPKWLALQDQYTGPWLSVYLLLTILALLPHLATLMFWQGLAAAQQLPQLSAALQDTLRSGRTESWQAWQLLIGLHRDHWTSIALTVALLMFVLLRAMVTVRVSALKHAQDLSGWTPARRDYQWLVPVHYFVSALWIVAIGSILWHLWKWLTTPLVILR